MTRSYKSYPSQFRAHDTQALMQHLRARQSVELVGMKRVGINNFLRFFLSNDSIVSELKQEDKHLFVVLDLNDLVETTAYAFWQLMFKRLTDAVEQSQMESSIKKSINTQFLNHIQSQDHFLSLDALRAATREISDGGYLISFFIIRFDRLVQTISEGFVANLHSLVDASNQKIMYVFTTYRSFYEQLPTVFKNPSSSVFLKTQYIAVAQPEDMFALMPTLMKKYSIDLDGFMESECSSRRKALCFPALVNAYFLSGDFEISPFKTNWFIWKEK